MVRIASSPAWSRVPSSLTASTSRGMNMPIANDASEAAPARPPLADTKSWTAKAVCIIPWP